MDKLEKKLKKILGEFAAEIVRATKGENAKPVFSSINSPRSEEELRRDRQQLFSFSELQKEAVELGSRK